MQNILYSIIITFSIIYTINNQSQIDQNQQIYKQWQQQYRKKYINNYEEQYRQKIFNENYQKIDNYNKQNHTYKQQINKFADLTDEEFISIYLTLDPQKNYNKKIQNSLNLQQTYNSIDWTQKGKVPQIKDQGDCGSCWAFSAVGTLEINTNIKFNEIVNLSEQELVDCAGIYGNAGCDGGWMDSAYEYINDKGLAYSIDYPYTAKDGICKNVKRKFIKQIDIWDLEYCDDIYDQIQYQAISVAVDATNWRFYYDGIFNDCKNYLNHGVILVGIDTNGNWKIRNSWGQDWGKNGYIILQNGDTCGICLAASIPILN